MSAKEDLLRDLTVKELRQLAKENRIKLVEEDIGGTYSVTRKEEIIKILLESPRITKKKILAIIEPPPHSRNKSQKKKCQIELRGKG